MNDSQINWIGRRNWSIEFVKPLINDSQYNLDFSVAVELVSDRDLCYSQLLFADAHLEISE